LLPVEDRQGYVFKPLPNRRRSGDRLTFRRVGIVASKIGEAANVKVLERNGKVKYASTHDLRRSFGERWSTRVMPPALQELMRHENIQTTMRYYVGQNAARTSAVIWEAYRQSGMGAVLGAETKEGTRDSSQVPY
jgi:integrase